MAESSFASSVDRARRPSLEGGLASPPDPRALRDGARAARERAVAGKDTSEKELYSRNPRAAARVVAHGRPPRSAPKGPKSAYMFFSIEERPKLVKSKPNLAFGEVGKALGAAWAKMSAGAKKPYEAKAAKDKARYEKEKAAYAKKKK